MTDDFIYIVDPTTYKYPVIGKIAGKSKDDIYYVSYVLDEMHHIAVVPAALIFTDWSEASRRYNEIKSDIESLK